MSRRALIWVLVAVTVVGLVVAQRYERPDPDYPTWSPTAERLHEYLREHPGGRSVKQARRELRAMTKKARAALGKHPRPPGDGPAAFDALLAWIPAHDGAPVPLYFTRPPRADIDALDAGVTVGDDSAVASLGKQLGGDGPEQRIVWALEQAFEELLGSDLVRFEAAGRPAAPGDVTAAPALAIAWRVSPSAVAYKLSPGANARVFRAVRYAFDLRLTAPGLPPISFTHEVEPPEKLEYTSFGHSAAFAAMLPTSDASDGDVYAGLAAHATRSLFEALRARVVTMPGTPPPAARTPAERAADWCDRSDHDACFDLAGMLLRGDGVARDPARAAQLLEKACLGRVYHACTAVAELLLAGELVPRDPDRARLMLANCALVDPDRKPISILAPRLTDADRVALATCKDAYQRLVSPPR